MSDRHFGAVRQPQAVTSGGADLRLHFVQAIRQADSAELLEELTLQQWDGGQWTPVS